MSALAKLTVVGALLLVGAPALAEAPADKSAQQMHVETPDEAWIDARPRPKIAIRSSIAGGKWRKRRAVNVNADEEVALRVKPVDGAEVRWYVIFADIIRFYKNANHPWEEDPYAWTGLQKIDYHRIELANLRGQWEVRPLTETDGAREVIVDWFRAADGEDWATRFYRADAGTFWYQAEVWRDGALVSRSPGIEDADQRGISTRVLRVSVRRGDDYLGHLTAFFNVPGVFGSILYQSRHHIGADCADVLMAAWAEWKKRKNNKNYNVQMLVGKFKKRVKTAIDGGDPSEQIRWGEDVEPGDFIAVNYDDSKRYHHIGALYSDENKNGLLDAGDLVLHAGPAPLHLTQLKSGAFDGDVVILKP
jgi:hypothetical protein